MINVAKVKTGTVAGITGAAALIVACIPCCISLVAPILAWPSVTSFGAIATGWYFAAMGVFALGAAAFFYGRFRRGASCQVRSAKSTCGCGTTCKS